MGATGRLHIERFRAEYLVPTGHPAPERLQRRLDAAARRDLPRMLQAALAPWLDGTDESVWVIRSLDLELDVDGGWEERRVTHRWAGQVAQALARTLAVEAGTAGVIRFENRAAYLARFLGDLAAGDAWGRWYYVRWRGLRPLPTSAALRTAVCDDPERGLAALLRLAAAERARVLDALSAQDARRMLDALPAGAAADHAARCWSALAAAGQALRPPAVSAHAEAGLALELYLRACDGEPALSGPLLRSGARALVRLAHRLAGATPAHADDLLAALADGDAARLYRAAGASDAEALWPLRDAPAELLEAVWQAAAAPAPTVARDVAATEAAEPRHTPYGGFFLLLPLLDRLPLEEAARDWPPLGNVPAGAALRLLLLTKCLGRPRAERVFREPLLRDLTGIPPELGAAELRHWAERLSGEAPERLLAELVADAKRSGAAGEVLMLLRAPLPGAPVAVLLDARTGVWLWARGYAPSRLDALVARLVEWLAATPLQPELVLAEPELLAPVRAAQPELPLEAIDGEAARRWAAEDARLAGVLARRHQLAGDLGYLALPAAFGLGRRLDLALSVAAQRTLREFAARLPGFAASSPAFLNANFLAVPGSLQEEPARRVARVGRPPLQLVLAMSGLARGDHRLSWLADRPFVLFQDGD